MLLLLLTCSSCLRVALTAKLEVTNKALAEEKASVEQHSCYNCASGIPVTSAHWLALCCAFLLGDWSQTLLLHLDLPR
jgi:hypothetical protein